MDQVSSPPLVSDEADWDLKFKRYPHFDAPLSRGEIRRLVYDPKAVAANSFYPFMLYSQHWQPFRGKDRKAGTAKKPDKKERPIRFASRRDAYIFSFYRFLLSGPYECLLKKLGLDEAVIAYRKLQQPDGSGKSNIHFARNAFSEIGRLENCAVVALDVSSFFESLDHAKLKAQWLRVMGLHTLPPDHDAVYRAVTEYAVVEREAVYQRLGYLEEQTVKGRLRLVYTKAFDEVSLKLCSNSDFQEKVCGRSGKYKSLIYKHRKPFGIPQGLPISDVLANMYLLDFDTAANDYCKARGGIYLRYSDDILMIIPGSDAEALDACNFACQEIVKQGPKLENQGPKDSCPCVYAKWKAPELQAHKG